VLNFKEKSLEILGTLKFDEISLTTSLSHLITRKNKFPAKRDQKFEFLLKMKFELISS
jgi:hypothetical protein